MASYKNQHFVPRCYLKPFTLRGEGRAINLFNVDRSVGIQNAPVKSQCSGDFFYGEDLRLEKMLQKPEQWYATTLRHVQSAGYSITEDDKSTLRRFCYLQYCRTDAAAQRAALSMSEISEIAFGGDVPLDWKKSMKDAVAMGMLNFVETMATVDDLKVCLIRNRTSRQFVTSDDPAILTNRWYIQNPRAKGLSSGVGSAGAIFILPLTPEIICIIYDGDVYTVPNELGWAVANDTADVDAFNQHQFLNCLTNIYFVDWTALAQISDGFAGCLTNRPSSRHEVVVAVLNKEDSWGKQYRVVDRDALVREGEALIHIKGNLSPPTRWPSIIKFRTKPKSFSNGTGTGFVRRSRIEGSGQTDRPYFQIRT